MKSILAISIVTMLVFNSAFVMLDMNVLGSESDTTPLFSGAGFGTIGDPYLITDVDLLQEMNLDLGANYTLMNDIDASATFGWNGGQGFVPVGTESNRFNGTLNGNNHTVTGLFINRSGTTYVGLFGFLGSRGLVKNLGLAGSNITGNQMVGGLAGLNFEGIVSNCYATGNVSGNLFIGGLIGDNRGWVNDSHASGNTTGSDFVGGLVGTNRSPVNNSHAAVNTTGTGIMVGGLVGENRGPLNNSHATGNVSGNKDKADLVLTYE